MRTIVMLALATWHRITVQLLIILSMTSMIAGLGYADEADLETDLLAAAEGDARALFRLAARYETGNGVTFDPAIAVTLLETAAMRGDAASQYRLGLLKAGGIGSEVDLDGGLKWLLLAQKSAPDQNAGLLGEVVGGAVAARLEPAKIEAAGNWAAAFMPVKGPVDLRSILGASAPVASEASLKEDLRALDCGWPLSSAFDEKRSAVIAYAPGSSVDSTDFIGDLRRRLANKGVALEIRELSAPICTLRNLISGIPDRMIETGISLIDAGGGLEPDFAAGDLLVLDVEATDWDRYIAIDYVMHSGEVLRLYPSGSQEGFLAAGQSLRLGDGRDGRQPWQISAPFGRDLLIVTLAEQPTRGGSHNFTGNVDHYVGHWQEQIAAIGAGHTWHVFERVILTRPR